MGVTPSQVADLLALKGDSIDNIPGAPGIGDKGAKDLIAQFGSVEAALEHAAEVERKMYRESLQNNREQILLSKRLATIDTAVPIEFSLEMVKAQEPDLAALKQSIQGAGVPQPSDASWARAKTPARAITRRFRRREAVDAWLAAIPAGRAGGGRDRRNPTKASSRSIPWGWPGSPAKPAPCRSS